MHRTPLLTGWLQRLDPAPGRKKRHLYYVLTPTYIGYFLSEDHAEISEEGFMYGCADADTVDDTESHGARVELADVVAVDAYEGEGAAPILRLRLRSAHGDGGGEEDTGTNGDACPALLLECANLDIATGWAGAIESQAAVAGETEVPPRTLSAASTRYTNAAAASSSALAGGVGNGRGAAASARGGGLFSRGRSLFSSVTSVIGLGGGPREPTRTDDEYTCFDWWGGRSIDLQAKANAQFLTDEERRPASVLHGWLTKRNKSGVRTGVGERERYFVLTPSHLCFFPDERVAAVVEGYVFGRAEGTKTGLFGRTGGRLSLEAVCEVRLLGTATAAAAARQRAVIRQGRRGGRQDEEGDDGDDGDDDGGGEGGASGGGSAGNSSLSMFEVDFGDVTLVCNAHNDLCRSLWVKGIRRWSAWRKRSVDEAMFSNLATEMRARDEEKDDDDE